MRPLHPCGNSACPTLVRTPYCPAHTTERHKDPAQAKFYGSAQWKAIRKVVKARDPICTMCHRKPTTNADHIDGDWRNNDPSNHRGLCDTCDRRHSGAQHYRKRAS